ncbi:hypothetical protein SLEP1_g56821 [Rubroshorea leprosula]|uniref:Myb/SANT-like DNA-binding domain-containing protein n=1 Tax=Rubroshorea leprosula TaxID=152421 RepID=A0AAV5MJF0_9ROSI|nr:hypothetical protein SLEP1_g56821 [Rubroshorea leprosula]
MKVIGFEVIKELYEDDPDFSSIWKATYDQAFQQYHCQQDYLFKAKFAYNNSLNQATGKYPFEVLYGMHPLSPLNLAPLPTSRQFSTDVEQRAKEIKKLHEEVHEKLQRQTISIWDEISTGMHNLGYSRSAKKCKERWENINKDFRKSIGSVRKRFDNGKRRTSFQELNTLYSNDEHANAGNPMNYAKNENDKVVDIGFKDSNDPSDFKADDGS